MYYKTCTVRLPYEPKIVAVVDRWSLLRGHLCYKIELGLKIVAVINWWLLFGGGHKLDGEKGLKLKIVVLLDTLIL